MEFNPANHVIQLCIQAMELEEKGKPEEASRIFLQAWNESTNDFEKFTSAFYVARQQERRSNRLGKTNTRANPGMATKVGE